MNSTLEQNISIYRQSLGIALVLVGVPLGMFANYFFPFIKWSPIFMVISILLIFSYRNLANLEFPLFNKYFGIIILFQIIMLFYCLLSTSITITYIPFHIYIIFLSLSLSSLSRFPIILHTKLIVKNVFYVSCLTSILGVYVSFAGLVIGETAWQLKQDFADYALEPFTVAQGVLINFIACLFIYGKNKTINILICLFIILDIYVLFSMGKREPIAVAFFSIIIFLYKRNFRRVNSNITLRVLIYLALSSILLLILYVKIDSIRHTLDNFWFNFSNGILNILGFTNVSDQTGSAIVRVYSRDWAYNYIDTNFDFTNYLFGAGYNTRWLDSPLLQSYLDMGLLGVLIYFYLVVYFPLTIIFKKRIHIFILFTLLFCLTRMLVIIAAGTPYLYTNYSPLCLLAFSIALYTRNKSVSYYKRY